MNISFSLENCYGIKKFDQTIIFSNDKPIVIHASNGTMKSSLCKTIQDITEGKNSQDLVVPSNITKRIINIDGIPADKNSFFVVNQFSAPHLSEYTSHMLLNSNLKKSYDTIVSTEKTSQADIIRKIAQDAGTKSPQIEDLLKKIFKKNDIYDTLKKAYLAAGKKGTFITCPYKHPDLFSQPVKTFVETKEVHSNIIKYNRQYNTILRKSSLFTAGIFDLSNLSNIRLTLVKEKFFDGGNRLLLKGQAKPISTEKDLDDFISSQLQLISSDPAVQEAYKRIDDQCASKSNLSKLNTLIKTDPTLCLLYKDFSKFEYEYILMYINKYRTDISTLINEHNSNISSLKTINDSAKKDLKVWKDVLSQYRKRFSVPFSMEIVNAKNVVIGRQEPQLVFKYENVDVSENILTTSILSTGERKALYLLEILFEIESMNKAGISKIIVFDDVADSFDYCSKHAIIEYLKEISENNLFHIIVLTNNFDFYRHFGSKVAGRPNCFFGIKETSMISLQKGEYLKNIFQDAFKTGIGTKTRIDLATIPFARNLIEYYFDDYISNKMYLLYTSLLHYRANGSRIRINTVYDLYKKQFSMMLTLRPKAQNATVYSLIIDEADKIASSTVINQRLEDKIVLSIALRLRVEKYMHNRLLKNKKRTITQINNLECGNLFNEFRQCFPGCSANSIIDMICILTPQQIHINAFMYEPLIDFSIQRLRGLYLDFTRFKPIF